MSEERLVWPVRKVHFGLGPETVVTENLVCFPSKRVLLGAGIICCKAPSTTDTTRCEKYIKQTRTGIRKSLLELHAPSNVCIKMGPGISSRHLHYLLQSGMTPKLVRFAHSAGDQWRDRTHLSLYIELTGKHVSESTGVVYLFRPKKSHNSRNLWKTREASFGNPGFWKLLNFFKLRAPPKA